MCKITTKNRKFPAKIANSIFLKKSFSLKILNITAKFLFYESVLFSGSKKQKVEKLTPIFF